MLEFLQSFFTEGSFIPHGHCYLWKPELVWLHIISNSLITIAYYSILITLVYFVQKQRDLPFNWIFLLFGALILSCGTTHIMEVWTLWHPMYWLSGFIKALSAGISVCTAVIMVRIIPKALALSSPAQLEAANHQLEAQIIERRCIEAKLRSSQGMLQLVMDNIPQFIFWKDKNSVYLGCNRNFAIAAGFDSPEDIVGKTDYDLPWKKEESDFYRQCDARVMETDTPEYHIIETQLQADGKQAWVDTNKIPLHDAEGQVVGILGTYEDITDRKLAEEALKKAKQELEIRVEERTTLLRQAIQQLQSEIEERKQAQEALRQSEERFRSLSACSPVGIYVTDIQGRCTYTNPRCQAIAGFTWEESLATGWSQSVHPDDRESVFADWSACAREGREYSDEYRFQTRKGIVRWVHVRSSPMFSDIGELIGHVGTVEDITQRKLAQEALRATNQTLQTLIQASPLAIVTINADGNVTMWNPAAERLFGWSEQEVLGHSLPIIPLDKQEEFSAICQDKLQGKSHSGLEVSRQRKDGSLIDVSLWTAPLFDGNGIVRGSLGLLVDITDRKQAEEELRRSEARFREVATREALINRLASLIRNSLDRDTILDTAVLELYNQLRIDVCLFGWYRPDSTPSSWEIVKEVKNPDLPSYLGFHPLERWGPFICKLVNYEVFQVDNVTESSCEVQQMLLPFGTTALLSLPIQTQSGELGALTCGRLVSSHSWTDEELELLQAVANQLVIGINQAQLYEQSRIAATTAQTKANQLEVALRELQKAQAQLIQTEKMSSLGQLVAGVAHEINNPVNFIYGNLTHANQYASDLLKLVQLYQEYYPHPTPEIQASVEEIELDFIQEDLPKLLKSMKMGADRIRNIVVSLRSFSRLDEAKMKLVDLHEGLDNTLLILTHRLKTSPLSKGGDYPGIQVIKEYGDLPKVQCYAGQLNQVFMNILANAIDALEELKVERLNVEDLIQPSNLQPSNLQPSNLQPSNLQPSNLQPSNLQPSNLQPAIPCIRICTEVHDTNQVLIRIVDNGSGMTEEVRGRLFDPFFTTKPVGSGTGLGMSISYQIVVEKHGGQLQCISAPGQGTEFLIYLPIQQQNRLPTQQTSA